ncbi:S8 family serine peptidase [Paenibacillus popilliae]|nr:S8 family serine peptidase [Paenibacillus popilliae]
MSVCAPSNNFNPMDPKKFAPGLGIWTTDNESGGFTLGSRYTGDFGGTSSATPLVAGVAALMLSANPDLRAAEVKTILQLTADKIQDTLPDHNGNNRGTYDQKGHSEWFGYGKVNAAKAVKEAKRRPGGVRKPQSVKLIATHK